MVNTANIYEYGMIITELGDITIVTQKKNSKGNLSSPFNHKVPWEPIR